MSFKTYEKASITSCKVCEMNEEHVYALLQCFHLLFSSLLQLVVVVYVVVVLWLVSSNFRQAASNARERGNSGFNTVARNIVRKVANFQGINRLETRIMRLVKLPMSA